MSEPEFRNVADLVHEHALARPRQAALVQDDRALSYAELDALMNRVAAALQRDGVRRGDVIALCGVPTPLQAALFLGALRAGAMVAPLAPSVTPAAFATMLGDANPRRLFIDASATPLVPREAEALCVATDDESQGRGFARWLAASDVTVQPVSLEPTSPINLIYSSGTTGMPKGIVQPHGMRWLHIRRGVPYGYGPDAVTLLATPLYSNTTLVAFFPAVGLGSTVVLMPKFDARSYLDLAQRYRATHTMLVPVQYQRILALSDFDRYDLSAFRMKFATSSPFPAGLKRDVLARFPGGLIEFYGMTEGGGTCILEAHRSPDKLHTVGRPAEGHDIRLIDASEQELPQGFVGEVVGHSRAMMTGYHGQPDSTRKAEWYSDDGKRFIRTGDIGRFDADGFLELIGRSKDVIISGGFNIYPSDIESELQAHVAVAEAAVVGVPSEKWGETPVAYIVLRDGQGISMAELTEWINRRVGKTQRVSEMVCIDELPRNALGKILKRELRERYRIALPTTEEGKPG